MAWPWAFRSAARLSRTTEASSSRSPTMAQELPFVSLSPNTRTTWSCYVRRHRHHVRRWSASASRHLFGEHKNLGASSPTELRKPFGSLIRGDTIDPKSSWLRKHALTAPKTPSYRRLFHFLWPHAPFCHNHSVD